MYKSVELLMERNVPREVAEFLVKCVQAKRVVHVINQFDRRQRPPSDVTAWFQSYLLDYSKPLELTRFGRKLAPARKKGSSKHRKCPPGRSGRGKKPVLVRTGKSWGGEHAKFRKT